LSRGEKPCARQLVEVAAAEECSVSAVQPTRESKLPYFGTVGATRVALRDRLYEITRVIEKPTPTQAEQELVVAGLRAGYYLCFFGMHVLTPAVMDLLGAELQSAPPGRAISLSSALSRLSQQERYLAMDLEGVRYNIGVRYGLLLAQLALSLSGRDRDVILTELVELLAVRS
jgi:UTP--glucose-1-phosphate uridylyltransferase